MIRDAALVIGGMAAFAAGIATILIVAHRTGLLPKRIPGKAGGLEEHLATLYDLFDEDADVTVLQAEAGRRAWDRHHGECLTQRLRDQFGDDFVRQFDQLDGPRRDAG